MQMRKQSLTIVAMSITVALIAAGCGGGGGDSNDSVSNSYLPMQVGNSWEYQMTLAPGIVPVQEQSNQLFDYHETITGIANHDGTDYFIFRSVREANDEYPQRAWQQIRRQDDEAIYARVGDPAYDLPVLMLPPREGDSWADPYFPEATFTVAAVGEQVTVPAGTFSCVRVEQTYETPVEGGAVVETTKVWFARGVGVVKEEAWDDDAVNMRNELTDYTVQ